MRSLNCERQVDDTRVFVSRRLRGTYCMQCRPAAVVGNGRRGVAETRKVLEAAQEVGATKVVITMRRHRGKTLYEVRVPRGASSDRRIA